MQKRELEENAGRGSAGGFSARIADRLRLKSDESRTFQFESSKGVVKVIIGKPWSPGDCQRYHVGPGSRPVQIEGVLRWYGMEYEIAIDNRNGSGILGRGDKASLFDRTANRYIEGDMPTRVYETLVPLIEMEADDILKRARQKKH